MEIVGSSAGDLFLKSICAVLENGADVAPRMQPTRELTGVQLRLLNPKSRFVGPETGRRINPAFAVAEALWILSGSNDPWIHQYNARLHQFVGAGSPPGAYGPRVRKWGPMGVDQLRAAYETLIDDPDSRRAVIQVFDPAIDPGTGVDVPCTLSYRFLLRDHRLSMFVTMRSQDVWLGLPYDVFSATVMMEVLASWLCVGLGEFTVSIDSLHIYMRDFVKANATLGRVAGNQDALRALATKPSNLDSTIEQALNNSADAIEGWSDAARILASHRLARKDLQAGLEMARTVRGPLGEASHALYLRRGGRS